MSIKVVIPQIGQSIAEATIVKWFKAPGESIEKGETLVEIGTDKINTEIPAPVTGVVELLLVQEGETVPVGAEIAALSGDGIAEQKSEPAAEEPQQISDTGRASHSPFVRKLAKEHGIDLNKITGSGGGGRVTKEDVLKLVASEETADAERIPMSRMRKLIAEHMVRSKRTTAELTTVFEVDMFEVVRQKEAGKLTYLPFVIYACARALKAFPDVNSSIEETDIVLHKAVHIGIATAVENGLVAPVIRNVERMKLMDMAAALRDIAEKARGNRLTPDDLQGGTFTITNPGGFGALMGTPIIHQPQVAILELGAVVKRPVVINDAIVIRPMAYLCLTYDHRAMDGAVADRFLAHIKNTLEKECPRPEL